MAMGFGQLGKVFVGGGRRPVGALPIPLPLSGAYCLVVLGPFSQLSRALRRAAVLRRARFAALEPRRALAVVPMAIVGLLGVSMPALAAVLFDPLPPGEESAAPITPPPPAKPLTGTEWRAQNPRSGNRLLPLELRAKERTSCAAVLEGLQMLNPIKTIKDVGTVQFSELFRSNIENSDCKKNDIIEYMNNIGSSIYSIYNYDNEVQYNFLIDSGFFDSPIFWIPEYSLIIGFDQFENILYAHWFVNK